MDEFAGIVANDVDAEQLQGLGVDDDFQEPGLVAGDLRFGHFVELRDAGFKGDFLLGELGFVLAHHGDFRDGVDAEGQEIGAVFDGLAEHVAGGEAALLHGRGGQ